MGFSNIQYLTLGRDKMRELKFRAWVHSESRYEYSENPPSFSFWKFIGYDERDLKTIEQYAGLKDKNGKEIYEGDILKINGGSNYLVKWFNDIGFDGMGGMHSGFYFDNKYRGNTELDYHLGFYKEEIEVVGNINENPELLTGKSNE